MPDHPNHPIIRTVAWPPLLEVSSRNATIVVAETPWGIQGAGESKREPGDVRNPERGYRLALGRALVNLGQEIQRRERQLIRREILRAYQERAEPKEDAEAVRARLQAAAEKTALSAAFANTPEARAKRLERIKRKGEAKWGV